MHSFRGTKIKKRIVTDFYLKFDFDSTTEDELKKKNSNRRTIKVPLRMHINFKKCIK